MESAGTYHPINREQRFAPRAVKFESVRDGLRVKVREQIVMGIVNELRERLADQVRTAMKIEDPVLREQVRRKLQARDRRVKGVVAGQVKELQERGTKRREPQ